MATISKEEKEYARGEIRRLGRLVGVSIEEVDAMLEVFVENPDHYYIDMKGIVKRNRSAKDIKASMKKTLQKLIENQKADSQIEKYGIKI